MEITHKICTKCGVEKSINEFPKRKTAKDGLRGQCKICYNLIQRNRRSFNKEYYRQISAKNYKENKDKINEKLRQDRYINREKLSEQKKKSYQKHKEKVKAKQREYHQNNKDEIAIKARIYREKNKDTLLIKKREYYLNNKESINIKAKKYRDTESGKIAVKNAGVRRRLIKSKGDLTTSEIKVILGKTTKCYWCNKKLNKNIDNGYHIDHYVPLSKGGQHTKNNIVISCPTCNLRKNAKDPIDFANSIGKLL